MPLTNQEDSQSYQDKKSPVLRCPIPPVGLGPVDNLRQFYNKGAVPQFRAQVISAALPYGSLTTGSTSTTTIVQGSSSSSSGTSGGGGTTPTSALGRVFTSSITTPTLNPGGIYQTTLIMARTYGVISVSVNAAARIRLYTNQAAANADAGRPVSVPIALGNPNGIVGDWLLQVPSEYQWFSSPMAIGFNADEPATTNVYAVISNPVSTSNPIQVSITFVSMEL